jgi:16S rRNA (guanine527-N7)-methyltransferase
MSEASKSQPSRLARLIHDEAAKMAVMLDGAAMDRLERFAVLFLKWNERINLASLSNEAELVERHFVDSFAASRLVPEGARVIDVGSGGGLPALPLASIRADVSAECFEPKQKKGAFLRTAVRELELGDRVRVHGRAIHQPVGPPLLHSTDVAMSRATLDPRAWLDLGRDLARTDGGRILVFATGESERELPAAAKVLAYGRNRRLLCYE